jgi:hypothetical protein
MIPAMQDGIGIISYLKYACAADGETEEAEEGRR